MKYIFAGDRQLAVDILNFMIEKGHKPSFLLLSEFDKASHDKDLIDLANLNESRIFRGKDVNSPEFIEAVKSEGVDYGLSIHFPYIIGKEILSVPRVTFLNLHPAYLPYNKGWHTPSWAILEGTPAGATLHKMEPELDAGDIIARKLVPQSPEDTANTLYQKILNAEYELFLENFDALISLNPVFEAQEGVGSSHVKKELYSEQIQKIELDKNYNAEDLIGKLRALTTNKIDEAAYFLKDGEKYRVQIYIEKEH